MVYTEHSSDIVRVNINLSSPGSGLQGVTPTGDQTAILQQIINSIPNGYGANLHLMDMTITVNRDINFPNYVNLVGRNAKIIMGGTLSFGERAIVEGIEFDGNMNCGGILAVGNDSIIFNNKFKNFKSRTAGSTVVLAVSGDGTLVDNNLFDTIEPYSENSIIGDAIGASRAIYCLDADCIITHNTFKNMKGYEDGDYIHVQNTLNEAVYWPFTESLDIMNRKFSEKEVKIESNTFYQDSKSNIKVQGSGVTIKSNKFYVQNTQYGSGVMRVQNSENVAISNNEIIVSAVVPPMVLLAEIVNGVTFSNNTVRMLSSSAVGNTHSLINLSHVAETDIRDNIIKIKNMNRFISYKNVKNLSIERNTVNCMGNDVGFFTYCPISTTLQNEEVSILGNKCKSVSDLSLQYTYINGGVIRDNVFQSGVTFYGLSSKNYKISNNSLKKGADLRAVYIDDTVSTGITGIDIIGNTFDGAYTEYIKINHPALKVRVSQNTLLGSGNLLYVNASQVKSEITYVPGSKIVNFDFGLKANRPQGYTLQIGHVFYLMDSEERRPIFWNGTGWYDLKGTLVV
ncbi:hypothetical protein BS1321_20615 [Peribacillus simplex NBRC 15720 = DSM 1321]|uniref:Right handed beta helix domain-containing protein n=2 Tax=Peribacillus simplex TaxID=1478 RepID=A0A223ELI8_9BACI|nr:hypothetical protein BS1321_20615 [Peribacillus simplex NBRC 15720 = DSM 1321]